MMNLIIKVLNGLDAAGIIADTAYPGGTMPNITEPQVTVSLEGVEYTARSATVLVTVMVPAAMGGGECESMAIRVAGELEKLGGVCVQEACRFNGYADAFYVRVLATYRGSVVLPTWAESKDFKVTVGATELSNVVSFRAEQVVDAVTGTPLSTAVWTFRIEEEYGRGEVPVLVPSENFDVTISRSLGLETYTDCSWIACQVENTATGMRQIRKGIAKSRTEIGII